MIGIEAGCYFRGKVAPDRFSQHSERHSWFRARRATFVLAAGVSPRRAEPVCPRARLGGRHPYRVDITESLGRPCYYFTSRRTATRVPTRSILHCSANGLLPRFNSCSFVSQHLSHWPPRLRSRSRPSPPAGSFTRCYPPTPPEPRLPQLTTQHNGTPPSFPDACTSICCATN